MRKYIGAIIFLLIFQSFGISVFAGSSAINMDNLKIAYVVNEDGTVNVQRDVTYKFTGAANTVVYNIDYSNMGDLQNLEVFKGDGASQTKLLETDKVLDGTYSVQSANGSEKIMITDKSKDESKTYVFKYKLTSAITAYKDICQLKEVVIDNSWPTTIGGFTANFSLQNSTVPSGSTKIFVHGVTGPKVTVNKDNSGTVISKSVKPYKAIAIDYLFPVQAVKSATNVVDQNMYQKIIDGEKLATLDEQSQNANEDSKNIKTIFGMPMVYVVDGAVGIIWILIMIIFVMKYGKKHKVAFSNKAISEMPGDYPPAFVSYLLKRKFSSNRALVATILSLMKKGYITIKIITFEKKKFMGNRNLQAYSLKINENKGGFPALLSHETKTLEWLSKIVGSENELDNFKDILEKDENKGLTNEFIEKFAKKVKNDSKKCKFYENQFLPRFFGVLAFGSTLFSIYFAYRYKNLFFLEPVILGIITLLYSFSINRRTIKGQEELLKWNAFKNYLKNLKSPEETESGTNIFLIENYISYSVVLGVFKDLNKRMNQIFKKEDFQSGDLVFIKNFYNEEDNSFTLNNVITSLFKSLDDMKVKDKKEDEDEDTKEMEILEPVQGKGAEEEITEPIQEKTEEVENSEVDQEKAEEVENSEVDQEKVEEVETSEVIQEKAEEVETSEPVQERVEDLEILEPEKEKIEDHLKDENNKG